MADDIIVRLKIYDQLGPVPSLWIHPTMPGYTTGRLYGDAKAARAEIKNLRVLVTRLTDKLEDLRRDIPDIGHPDLDAVIYCGRNRIYG